MYENVVKNGASLFLFSLFGLSSLFFVCVRLYRNNCANGICFYAEESNYLSMYVQDI